GLDGGEEQWGRETLIKAITSGSALGEIKSNKTEMLHQGGGGRVSGRLLGGCLSLIAAMMGTPYELGAKDSILFLEDTATRPYAIDRMLHQLKLAGKLLEV